METGFIFNIQKFSINDGPGIRTVVFFKGCPLRCRWCANPESQNFNAEILWNEAKCASCQKCIAVCPPHAVSYENERIHINFAKCTACGSCIRSCPNSALTPRGERRTVSEVTATCLSDLPFYEESGGGVTLSGGEFLSQMEFSEALLRELKKQGLHTAVETSGYASAEDFAKVLPYIDLFLFDMKHWDAAAHRNGTGVSNECILRNMRTVIDHKISILPRIPIIPGFNNSLDDARGFARTLRNLGLNEAQLLPFHQLGAAKYSQLGKDYSLQNLTALHEEDLADFKDEMRHHGIHAFF